jgi:chlorobactene glucosyltransferase
MTYFLLSTAFFIGGLVTIYWLHDRYHLDVIVESANPPIDAPLISVCIPARNEEQNIRKCVEAVLEQDYPTFEIIVLDDRSNDSTPAILADIASHDPRLHLINGSDLPPGWAGKPHALYQASVSARGEWLCFVDSDTFLTHDALSSCYSKAFETNADMFTIMTFQILGSFWEKVIMPLVMTALSVGFSPRKVNDPSTKDAIANGQFILIKHSVYNEIGGHESVRDSIVEDKAIAEKVKWGGYRLIVADGMKIAKTRMYTSLPEVWEGWTKNIYLGLREQNGLLWLGVFGAFLAFTTALFLPLWPVLGIIGYSITEGWIAFSVLGESVIFWAYLIIMRAKVANNMNISAWYALTTPLGAGIFGAMMITSAWRVLSGQGVSWRGRLYKPN